LIKEIELQGIYFIAYNIFTPKIHFRIYRPTQTCTDHQAIVIANIQAHTGLTNSELLERRKTYLAGAVDNNLGAYELAKVQYDVGQTDLLSVLQIQSRWVGARVGLLNVKNQQLAERINLHLAPGGSFEESSDQE
jgi:multidrug efflux system outer membrane protein